MTSNFHNCLDKILIDYISNSKRCGDRNGDGGCY